jgi:hypothetical protein
VDGSQEGANMADAESRHAPINYGGMNLGKGGEVAQAITLDSLGLTGISFIKVDVQGAEQLTLFGAQASGRAWPECPWQRAPGEAAQRSRAPRAG